MASNTYNAQDFGGKKEVELQRIFRAQIDDAKSYFKTYLKPRFDRFFKVYIAYSGDRAKEIKTWQSNITVPYAGGVIETLMPRILDARPEFICQARKPEDQPKNEKQQMLQHYLWELSKMDAVSEDVTRSAMIYGHGFLQPTWKKDVREYSFLDTKDFLDKNPKYKKEQRVFYDAPFCENVDVYSLLYDGHNIARKLKRYWFKRLLLTEEQIRQRYPMAQEKRLNAAFHSGNGELADYAEVRTAVKKTHSTFSRNGSTVSVDGENQGVPFENWQNKFQNVDDVMKFHEVLEWTRPLDDSYCVMVNEVPILKGASIPIAFDHKEASFIEVPYLRLPGEFEGRGIPEILEGLSIALNSSKNQRLDIGSLSIHKMFIVNPLANINKQDLVTRPFGIIYSPDPNAVREIQFSDIKSSAYREEELLKGDMRYASGVDDVSMGVGGGASSATEVRHLRESTLERVRLFVNHLGDAFAEVMRHWMSMQRQFFTENMQIRITGESGKDLFPFIEKDDLMGEFDYRAQVLPSIAGQNDIEKKQMMDIFQLLITLPFIDPEKLTGKTLSKFPFSLESIKKMEEGPTPEELAAQEAEQAGQPGMEGMPPEQGMPLPGKNIPPDVLAGALGLIRGESGQPQGFGEAQMPIDLTKSNAMPPTVGAGGAGGKGGKGVSKTTNLRGMNRKIGGRVDTGVPLNKGYQSSGDKIARDSVNLQ